MRDDRRSKKDLLEELEALRSEIRRYRGEAGPGDEDGTPRLDTVRVPEEIAPVFLRAQEYVRRYFANRVENPAESTISISGERYILLRAASMSVEFFDLVTSLYRGEDPEEARNVANNLLFDIAHAIGKADARAFQQRANFADPIERLSAGPIHFAFSGWAFVDISPESKPVPTEDFFLVYDHPFSFESDAWLSRGKRSEGPVCIMSAGYSSGWCEESFGFPLVAAEIECTAAGGKRCRFIMAPPSEIERHVERHTGSKRASRRSMGPEVRVPEFFQRKRMEEELRRSRDLLEIRIGERTAELMRTNDLLRDEVTERRAAETQLRLLESAVQSTLEGIVILSPATDSSEPRIVFVNEGFCRLTDLEASAVQGETLGVLRVSDDGRRLLEELHQCLAAGKAFRGEGDAVRADGSPWVIELHAMPIRNADGLLTHWVVVVRDVTERREQIKALAHQALHDDLTGLPNRALVLDRLDHAIRSAHREERPLALLIMDLDRFKDVNDTFGHHFGDLLLIEVAERLRGAVRDSDTIGRLGGDEFAALQPAIAQKDDAARLARKLLGVLERPIVIQDQMIDVGASVGVALYPDHGDDAETLMRHADVAMYQAKQSNSGMIVYSEQHDRYTPFRLALSAELRHALEEGEFVLHYQPKVSMRDGIIHRAEALVRWNHPSRGLILPEEFIPLAERTAVIRGLTYWVLEVALDQCVEWRRRNWKLGVAVNLSTRVLQEATIADTVERMLNERQLPANALKIEVTESSIISDPDHVSAILYRLGRIGVRLSLDDFGTGYSSLAHLRSLPFDEIKIDKSFIAEMTESNMDAAIVESTIALCHSLGRKVAAEGVEDERTWRMLLDMGCDLVQGFHVTRALPADELDAWFDESKWIVERDEE